ncbi:MAG: STAS/SEC14 domain-containing protein [Arenicellales bacterium]|jgi:hypothetical protein
MSIDLDLLTVDSESDPRVIRATVSGRLEESDYHALASRVEELLKRHASLRLLVQLSEFKGWSAGGAWEDAKLGLQHYSDFERLAVVGGRGWEEWLTHLVKPFTLADVRFFEPPDMEKALAWIAEPSHPRIKISVEEDSRVVRVHPSGRLSKDDFLRLAEEIDPLIEEWGSLNGLVIETRDFPGWESVGAFVRHMTFVSGHHKKIARIALVTDSPLGSVAEHVAGHFVSAKIKQFEPADLDVALSWASKESEPRAED